MNWTQPKSFVNDNQKTINVMGNKLPKGVTLVKGVEGRGGGGCNDEQCTCMGKNSFPYYCDRI